MKLFSNSFRDGGFIPGEFAFCVIDPKTHVTLSTNRNPHLGWSDLPAGTRSLTLVCHDPDVPSRGDDVNQAGKSVPADLERVDFFHWSLIDLPPDAPAIEAGEFSDQVTPRGKPGPEIRESARAGARQGINDYTGWFSADADMKGQYFGYDGPCPPWNDMIIHRYVFTLYALSIARLPVENGFTGQQVLKALRGNILAEASLVGLFTLNPQIGKTV